MQKIFCFIFDEMKRFFLSSLFFFFLIVAEGQDSIRVISTKPQTIKTNDADIAMSSDYYAFWHEKNNNLNGNVSEYGFYISGILGFGGTQKVSNFGTLGNLSIAYKSHLFTLTAAANGFLQEYKEGEAYLKANYVGVLYGESIRLKHALISLSTGVANCNVNYNSSYKGYHNIIFNQQSISFPMELKILRLAYNGVGIGLHISYNINPHSQYSVLYFGLAFVFGSWNRTVDKPKLKDIQQYPGAYDN